MTSAIYLSFAIVLLIGAVAWFGTRRQAIAFAVVAVIMAPASFLPLGHAAPWLTTCPCTVLGARIDPEEAIWVMLDGAEPRFYKLPYSVGAANALQAALDGSLEKGSKVKMKMGEDGSPGFSEDAPPPDPVKVAPSAAILN